jgi:hypothetical protein
MARRNWRWKSQTSLLQETAFVEPRAHGRHASAPAGCRGSHTGGAPRNTSRGAFVHARPHAAIGARQHRRVRDSLPGGKAPDAWGGHVKRIRRFVVIAGIICISGRLTVRIADSRRADRARAPRKIHRKAIPANDLSCRKRSSRTICVSLGISFASGYGSSVRHARRAGRQGKLGKEA